MSHLKQDILFQMICIIFKNVIVDKKICSMMKMFMKDTLMERSLLSFLDNDFVSRVGANVYTQFFFRRRPEIVTRL